MSKKIYEVFEGSDKHAGFNTVEMFLDKKKAKEFIKEHGTDKDGVAFYFIQTHEVIE